MKTAPSRKSLLDINKIKNDLKVDVTNSVILESKYIQNKQENKANVNDKPSVNNNNNTTGKPSIPGRPSLPGRQSLPGKGDNMEVNTNRRKTQELNNQVVKKVIEGKGGMKINIVKEKTLPRDNNAITENYQEALLDIMKKTEKSIREQNDDILTVKERVNPMNFSTLQTSQMITKEFLKCREAVIMNKVLQIKAKTIIREEYDQIEPIAKLLGSYAKTEIEKAWIVYYWIAQNIAYDTKARNEGIYTCKDPNTVIQSGVAICSGYAKLFAKLCELIGLESQIVSGYSKGAGYFMGTLREKEDHGWNVVKINDKWYHIDTTWGAGTTKDDSFKSELQPFYFLTCPESFIATHLSADIQWQFMKDPVTVEQFDASLAPTPYFFALGLEVLEPLNPKIEMVGSTQIKLKVPNDISILAKVNNVENACLCNRDNETVHIDVMIMQEGSYTLQIFGKQKTKPGPYDLTLEYQLDCKDSSWMSDSKYLGLPKTYMIANDDMIWYLYSPKQKFLMLNDLVHFKIRIPKVQNVMITMDDNEQHFLMKTNIHDEIYEGIFKIIGENNVKICAQTENKNMIFQPIIEYQITKRQLISLKKSKTQEEELIMEKNRLQGLCKVKNSIKNECNSVNFSELIPIYPMSKAIETERIEVMNNQELQGLIKNVKRDANSTIDTIFLGLEPLGKTDIEKAWVIFYWICHNISCDDNPLMNNELTPNDILKKGKALSPNYCKLYKSLANKFGLTCEVINGYCKGCNYIYGKIWVGLPNHYWCTVKIYDNYYFIDIAWGIGSCDESLNMLKLKTYYFLTKAETFINNHWPLEEKWQLLKNPITLAQYNDSLLMTDFYFENGLEIIEPLTPKVDIINHISIKIKVPIDKDIVADVTGIENACLCQRADNEMFIIDVYISQKGEYKLPISVKDAKDESFRYWKALEFILVAQGSKEKNMQFPMIYRDMKMHNCYLYSPKELYLKKEENVYFKIKVPDGIKVAVVMNNQFNYLNLVNDYIFDGNVKIISNDIAIYAKFKESDKFSGLVSFNSH